MADFWGTSGADTIAGSALDDSIYGLAGDDSFEESSGLDYIDGGAGADRLVLTGARTDYSFQAVSGGANVQRLDNSGVWYVTSVEWVYFAGGDELVRLYDLTPTFATEDGDYLLGTDGDDTIAGLGGSDEIDGLGGTDTAVYAGSSSGFYFSRDGNVVTVGDVVGQEGFDILIDVEFLYFAGDDLLLAVADMPTAGSEGADIIVGSGRMEELLGNGGDDILSGGGGRDFLFGGAGADTFRYGAVADSNAAAPDTIEDFLPGTDLVDLTAIDADPAAPGDAAFSFIGAGAFSALGAASAGELRAFLVTDSIWQAEGDTDGDGVADLVIEIVVDGTQGLTAADFIL